MKILIEKPPNYDKIVATFPEVANEPYVLFAWGNVLYNPSGKEIPPEKIAHENVHRAQQLEVGVEWWWDTYLADKVFRLNEEIPAHRIDYAAFCEQYKDRNERNSYLQFLASHLSGKLYGSMISHAEAAKIIKNEKARS